MAATVWKGHLTFGLVSIPVRLYKAARAERVRMHQLRRTPAAAEPTVIATPPPPQTRMPKQNESERPQLQPRGPIAQPQSAPEPEEPETYTRVHRQWAAPEPVAPSEVVRGVEVDRGRYVAFKDEELKQLKAETSPEMKIEEFVKLDQIDPIYFENSYYVAPDEGGEKAYALLYEAMKASNSVALAEVAMHGREHVVIIRSGRRGLIAHTMFYADEIRSEGEYDAPRQEPNPKEMALAKQLIGSLEAPFQPEKYKDRYRQRLEEMIAARAGESRPAAPAPEPKKAEVVDILSALQASLNAVRKPAASAPAPAAGKKRASRKTAT